MTETCPICDAPVLATAACPLDEEPGRLKALAEEKGSELVRTLDRLFALHALPTPNPTQE